MEPYFLRAKRARGEVPTTFQYNQIPGSIKEQAIILFNNSFSAEFERRKAIQEIHFPLTFHLGKPSLYSTYADSYEEDLFNFFRKDDLDTDLALTIIEEFCKKFSEKFIAIMNEKFLLEGMGYQFKGEEIVRIEDEKFYDTVTQPCISKLSSAGLEKAAAEYFKAYEHLKNQHYHDAVVSCTRSLEYLLQNRLGTKETELSKLLRQLLPQLEGPSGTLAKYVENYIKLIEGMNALRGQSSHAGNAVDFAYTMYFINQTAATILFIADVPLKSS